MNGEVQSEPPVDEHANGTPERDESGSDTRGGVFRRLKKLIAVLFAPLSFFFVLGGGGLFYWRRREESEHPFDYVRPDGGEWEVVYHASKGASLSRTMRMLREAGFTPVVLGPTGTLSDEPGDEYGVWFIVPVAVPPNEAERAREVLAKWETWCGSRVEAMARRLRRRFLGSLLFAAVICIIIVPLCSDKQDYGAWFTLFIPVWIGYWVVARVVARLRSHGTPPSG